MQKDFYAILGIASSATPEQLKKAYRINAIKYHPDKNFNDTAFAQKFIEIKEAYDVLIDPGKRKEFDATYYEFFSKNSARKKNYYENKQEERQQQKQKEEEFRHDPYKCFYSSFDREQQETPQLEPVKTPWGTDINGIIEFFILPKRIGKIIGGYSTIAKGTEIISLWKLLFTVIVSSYIILPCLAIVMFLIWQHWHFNLHKENATQIILIAFGIITSIIIAFRVKNDYNAVAFKHLNYFIGINGFALFKCENSKENVTSKEEVNFNDVTDLVVRLQTQKQTNHQTQINYQFLWLNVNTKKIVFEGLGICVEKKEILTKYAYPEYWLNKEAEKYWTLYLLDKMEKTLEEKGHLEFNIYIWSKNTFSPYINLGIGFITFLDSKENITYKFNDIKRMYTKGTDLFIEHKNYEKVLLFISSGNKNSIPLDSLCNRLFFIEAIEILLGYSIV